MAKSVASIHRRNGYSEGSYTYFPVVVIGAGVSGIAMGCRLKQVLGFDQFRIFERQSGIGGTWWINTYPGVACDVPSLFYSFSFAPKKDWSTILAPRLEFVQYLTDVCEKFKIIDKIQLNTDVRQLRWLEDEEEWEVTLAYLAPGTGDLSERERQAKVAAEGEHSVYLTIEIVRAKIVVSAVGGLVEPNAWPKDVPGIDTFEGDIIHTARWKKDVDLRGKDVIVIGTGCSAAQVVPELIKPSINVKSVTQLMRTPPWVVPNLVPPDKLAMWEKYSPTLLQNIPGLARFIRCWIFCHTELEFFRTFSRSEFARRRRSWMQEQLLSYMRKTVPEKYHEILTPNYSLGCKRRIFDPGWFRSLHAPNVKLTTLPLRSVQPKGVTLGPGRNYPPMSQTDSKVSTDEVQLPADAIILANGYQTNTWLHPLRVQGRGGIDLQGLWDERGGPQAYMGTAMDKFPNFFIIFGPNTATGHSSVILATENMVNYALKFIAPILKGEVSTYEVKEEAERDWTNTIQAALKETVFQAGGCVSWYSTENGWNSIIYPFSQIDFTLRCMFPVWSHWSAKYTRKGRMRLVLRRVVLLAAVSALVWLGRRPAGLPGWTGIALAAADSVVAVAQGALRRARGLLLQIA
ncbi:putative flavin-binding monooxygenase [Thermoascus aurantiacus ATCC 26904]